MLIKQGRIQDFFRGGGGCTTKEWRNRLVTGRKQILIANTKRIIANNITAGHLRGERGAHPLHPPPRPAPVK